MTQQQMRQMWKKLTDEIAETLNGHSKNMSDEDIDSLLQGAIEDISEK